ncbi:MAG: PilC/PilY family type IV pilus protein, partial [Dokdonella sp.]
RSTLTDNVTPFFPDTTTGVTGSTPLGVGADPASNKEVYFNPVNDPATWQHVVQFMVSLGAAGSLQFSDDTDCIDPTSDACRLRKGQTNSSGSIGWPQPDGTSSSTTTACPVGVPRNEGCARNLDDTWHAAINGRGSFFNANDPKSLVAFLTDILNQIIARRSTSTAIAVSLPVLTIGTQGYRGGYDSTDWSGYLTKVQLNADATVGSTMWDASCLLTGGTCASTGAASLPVRNPDTRVIFTSDGTVSSGKPFRWASLSATQKAKMNRKPNSSVVSSSWVTDSYGSTRVDYLRGVRTNEVGGSTPVLRKRSSVMGAVINAQPLYVSSPVGGFTDNYPSGSPEAVAAASGSTYAQYQYNNRNRTPMVYTAANDGMLHAFDATTGVERWAYVPNMLFFNDKLSKLTGTDYGLVSAVDDRPLVQDVFINGSWRTILVGSMRFGARGIYALDVTNPTGITEAGATAIPLWEFTNSSSGGANLGYTFNSVNVARLNNGKWVVLLASGYFPQYITGCIPSDCDLSAVTTTPGSASANQTSLFVIDLQTGALIKEILTTSAPQSSVTTYALSQPIVYDFAADQIDDTAVAGDLAGNLWRFDLSNASSASWKVDRMFSNYGSGGTAAVGNQPISVTPVPLTDPLTRGPIYIFGTGKFLGDVDRVSSIPIQSFYGIRDYGTASSNYPITVNQLVTLALAESASGVRSIAAASSISIDASKRGWTFPLNLSQEPGERNVVKATPLYTSNRAILTTLIPTGDDPCSPLRRGAIMVVDGGTGGAPSGNPPVSDTTGVPAGNTAIGKVLNSASIPAVGSIPLLTTPGGGVGTLPGISDLNIALPLWNRSAWRELLDRL